MRPISAAALTIGHRAVGIGGRVVLPFGPVTPIPAPADFAGGRQINRLSGADVDARIVPRQVAGHDHLALAHGPAAARHWTRCRCRSRGCRTRCARFRRDRIAGSARRRTRGALRIPPCRFSPRSIHPERGTRRAGAVCRREGSGEAPADGRTRDPPTVDRHSLSSRPQMTQIAQTALVATACGSRMMTIAPAPTDEPMLGSSRTRHFVLSVLIVFGMARPADADLTAFLGLPPRPTTGRARVCRAASRCWCSDSSSSTAQILDDEIEALPSLKTWSGNVLLQTPVELHGVQIYGTAGGGGYRERLGARRKPTPTSISAAAPRFAWQVRCACVSTTASSSSAAAAAFALPALLRRRESAF